MKNTRNAVPMRHNRRPATMWQRSCGQGAPGPAGHCRCTECGARGHPAAGDSGHARTDRDDAVPRHPRWVLARDRAGSSVCPICAFLYVNIYLLMVCLRNVSRDWVSQAAADIFRHRPTQGRRNKARRAHRQRNRGQPGHAGPRRGTVAGQDFDARQLTENLRCSCIACCGS